jgi:asparagine synthase (glutamine-hydrolysing)
MCGIAGIALKPGAELPASILAALGKALAHRGPDGSGSFTSPRVAMMQTRLAIIDLATGDQPLFAPGMALIGNGEIYNNRELRKGLPAAPFRTGSDCEPPLYLLARDGDGFACALRGMYALAVDDADTGAVVLARDPFGIKPLYLAETRFGLAFASEAQALIAAGLLTPQPRNGKLLELLQTQFTSGTETAFAGIDRLAPGKTISVRGGSITSTRHLDALEPGMAPPDEDAALAALDQVLAQSVELHQRSDVPYGLFLSGGIDSAAILAMMARLNTSPVQAFTAGFDVPGAADERDAAAALASAVGARHERVGVTQAMVWRHLPEIIACMDDPAADYAIIPSWFLARKARQSVKVVLSGEGGDEIFAGYGRYRKATRPFPFRREMRARGAFDGLDVLREQAPLRRGLPETTTGSRLDRAQRADIAGWLPDDLLIKLDRCLMAHGVEGRTPFLDREVARFAFALPDAMRTRGRLGKILLREWLARHLPAARPFARKQGFDVPVGAWIAEQGTRLGPLVAASPIIAELAQADRVTALFTRADDPRAGVAAWRLLFLALWHQCHVEQRAVDGDVFEVLEQR